MKILESSIFDFLNSVFAFIQSKTELLRKNSFLLSNIDYIILFFVVLTYFVSLFENTNAIAAVALVVPILVSLKFIITKGEKIELEKCNFYLLIYLLICFISNFTSSMIPQSIYGFSKTLMYFGFYFALCQFLKNNKHHISLLFAVIAVCVGFEGIIGISQNIIRVENLATWQDVSYLNPEDVLSRVYGTLKPYNPNLLAGFMIAGISCLIWCSCSAFTKKQYKTSAVVFLFFLLSSFTIFLTGSRAVYISLFTIFLGIIAASFQIVFNDLNTDKYKLIWKRFLAVFIFGFLAFMALNHKILQRLMSIFLLRGDSSASFRMNVYSSAVQMFQDNWLFGIGVGNKVFREIYGLYMMSGFDALSCYCIFLEMAVESGIFALIAYLMFIGTLLSSGIKCFINSKNFNYKILLFVSIISIIAVMVHGFFDTIYFRPQVQFIFWTMAAVLTVLTREEKTAEQ